MNLLYKIEVFDKPIEYGGRNYEKSVRVIEQLNQKKIQERYLGLVEPEEIYKLIDKNEPIELNNIYVKGFSLSDYRKERGIEEGEEVQIPECKIVESLFDCDATIDFTYGVFTGNADFNNTIFHHGFLDFTHARFTGEETNFSDCHFHNHNVFFQYASFGGERLTFEKADFSVELLSFISATIKSSTISFKRAEFNKSKVKFHFAEFGDGLKTFEKIKFYGSVMDFRRVIWGKGKIDFRRSIFGAAHITFEEMELDDAKITFRMSIFEGGDITFRRSNFGKGEINFDYVKFGTRSISFESCIAKDITIANADINSTLDLRIKRVDTIDLSSSYLHAITDLNFNKPDALKELSLAQTKNLGKIIIHWKKNNVRELIASQDSSDEDKADQFNVIKDNFTQNGQYADEDWAYVNYKRYEHKVLKAKMKERMKPFAFFVEIAFFLRKLVFDRVGLFATSPGRVLLSMVFAIIGFGCIYALFGLSDIGQIVNSVGAEDHLNLIERSIYHSAITFFTIGYGDFYPTSFNRFISATEGWVGVFLMSYFTVAFVRKALR